MTRIVILMALAALAGPPMMLVSAGAAHACPPGLAKKDPPCVPPGQVGRGNNDHDNGHGAADLDDLFFLDDYRRYSLPALPFGQRYAVVGDRIVVIDSESYEILQMIRLFTALAD
jgi:hypothetical protein